MSFGRTEGRRGSAQCGAQLRCAISGRPEGKRPLMTNPHADTVVAASGWREFYAAGHWAVGHDLPIDPRGTARRSPRRASRCVESGRQVTYGVVDRRAADRLAARGSPRPAFTPEPGVCRLAAQPQSRSRVRCPGLPSARRLRLQPIVPTATTTVGETLDLLRRHAGQRPDRGPRGYGRGTRGRHDIFAAGPPRLDQRGVYGSAWGPGRPGGPGLFAELAGPGQSSREEVDEGPRLGRVPRVHLGHHGGSPRGP